MIAPHPPVTFEDFKRFIEQPGNEDRLFELINGEIIEVMPGRTYNSGIGYHISFPIQLFCRDNGLPCYISGADGTYAILGDVVAPDLAYKQTPLSKEYPDPVPPLFAVEVISPTDKTKRVGEKRDLYRRAGILYWEIYEDIQRIDVYYPGEEARTLGINDTLDGGDVLPGFTLAVKDVFAGL